ncbi:hypothetical protein RUE5091_00603 [Ruegeria denitrificans]|uniref:Bile acid transporter n=1 Tax=Ruegeria denitrificans TaxID=1715692 RepID=A0A0P1I374_9RHOB|nr:hypothetical protein [Ruegeria denitrificans]CUJ87861.1 hypothetical protein RUE5091_00603 [Ruegeria denitrificans]
MNPLHIAARHGPYVLLAGLLPGLLLPWLAEPMRPLLPPMVVLLLFVTVLRMDPARIFGSLRDLHRVVAAVLGLQIALPLTVLGVGALGGWLDSPALFALLIMTAAPSIAGSPNMCRMMGHPSEYALRLLVIGTALLPLTIAPVFWLTPQLGGFGTVLWAALKLLATILLVTLAAIVIRKTLLRDPTPSTESALEGLANITLALFVIGLMPSVSEVVLADPKRAFLWITFACVANLGVQIICFQLTRFRMPPATATAVSLIAGNRNIALFFVALAPEITAPIMVFIGAYQIPMYLTPLLMQHMYRDR